jgi:phage major head subunit gpT-like protein
MPAGNSYALDSRDLIADFWPRLQAGMESIWAPRISVEIPSSRETEELAWLGQVPMMRRWIGGRKETTLNKYTLTVRNHPYETTLPISTDDLRRDKTGQIRQRRDALERTARHLHHQRRSGYVRAGLRRSVLLRHGSR